MEPCCCETGGGWRVENHKNHCIDCGVAGFPRCIPVLLVQRLAAGKDSTEDPWLVFSYNSTFEHLKICWLLLSSHFLIRNKDYVKCFRDEPLHRTLGQFFLYYCFDSHRFKSIRLGVLSDSQNFIVQNKFHTDITG